MWLQGSTSSGITPLRALFPWGKSNHRIKNKRVHRLTAASAPRPQVIGCAIALSLLTRGAVPLWAGVLVTAVDSFALLLIERLGVRNLEAVFAVLITVMAGSFGVMYVLAGVPTAEVAEGAAARGPAPLGLADALVPLACPAQFPPRRSAGLHAVAHTRHSVCLSARSAHFFNSDEGRCRLMG
jgi:hypothetical protein